MSNNNPFSFLENYTLPYKPNKVKLARNFPQLKELGMKFTDDLAVLLASKKIVLCDPETKDLLFYSLNEDCTLAGTVLEQDNLPWHEKALAKELFNLYLEREWDKKYMLSDNDAEETRRINQEKEQRTVEIYNAIMGRA